MIKTAEDMQEFVGVYNNSVREVPVSGNIGIGVLVDDYNNYMNEEYMDKLIGE